MNHTFRSTKSQVKFKTFLIQEDSPKVKTLKNVKSLKAYTKSNYVGLTTSATTALSLSLRVLGVRPGNLVGVADYSWPASSNVIEEIGAIRVYRY